MDTIADLMRDGFLNVRDKFDDRTIDEYYEHLVSLKMLYGDYLEYGMTNNAIKSESEQLFERKCNDLSYMPREIFKNMYGYACTECSFSHPERERVLLHAIKLFDGTRAEFAEIIPKWILSSLVMSYFLHMVCPPPEPECLDRPNDAWWQTMNFDMISAIDEVATGIDGELVKIDVSRRLQVGVNRDLKIPNQCRKTSEKSGTLITKDVPGYEFAEPVQSKYTVGEAEQKFEDVSILRTRVSVPFFILYFIFLITTTCLLLPASLDW
jgi:hypothetical protein